MRITEVLSRYYKIDNVISSAIALIVAFIVVALAFPFIAFIHEVGHAIFGYLSNILLYGTVPSFRIANCIDHPNLPFIRLPQRIVMSDGFGNLLFAFGGVILTVFSVSILSYSIYRISTKSSKKYLLYIPLTIAFHEGVGNIICGTDNLNGLPLIECNGFMNIISMISIPVLIISLSFYLVSYVHPLFKELLERFSSLKKPVSP